MLSFKRNINRLDEEERLLQSALNAYAGAISVIGNLPLAADPEATREYKESLREMEAQIGQTRDAEALDRSRETLRTLVGEYREKAQAAALKKEEDLRGVIEALSEATQVLSQQHSGQSDRLQSFSNRLQDCEKLTDLSQMRRRIIGHVRDPRTMAERSKRENEASISDVQAQLAEFSARLDQAERRASLDALTGLLNRGEGETRLNNLIQTSEELTAVLVDLNSFKRINDTWGHAAGDQVLKTSARILANFFRPGDLVCRWGGDEFLAVLRSREAVIRERIAILEAQLRAPQRIVVLGKLFDLSAGASIGVAGHRAGESPADFIARVDADMYRDKKGGLIGVPGLQGHGKSVLAPASG